MKVKTRSFGEGYELIEVTNQNGVTLGLSDLGARIVSLTVPHQGEEKNIVLGFDSAAEYLTKDPYIGSTIGRTAGRIAKGQATLNGQPLQVEVNPQTGHQLHGGMKGFEQRKWAYEIEEGADATSVHFTYVSPDQENGFPGTLNVKVTHTLTNQNDWEYRIEGTTDQATFFNPTNHVYFNLNGDVTQSIDNHQLWLDSPAFAEITEDVLPTGEKIAVEGTAFDFQTAKEVHTLFASQEPQMLLVGGLDHPFFLDESRRNKPQAQLQNADQSLTVSMDTNQSSVVIFTANFGDEGPLLHGKKLVDHGGITFETQTAPGAEQFPAFGSFVIQPAETAVNRTRFHLSF